MNSPLPTSRKRPPAVTPRLAVTRAGRAAAARAAGSGAPRILLVEDDPSLRAVFVNFLRHAGYEVVEAQDGADALAVLDREPAPVDLVVTDVVMPHTGGPAWSSACAPACPTFPCSTSRGTRWTRSWPTTPRPTRRTCRSR